MDDFDPDGENKSFTSCARLLMAGLRFADPNLISGVIKKPAPLKDVSCLFVVLQAPHCLSYFRHLLAPSLLSLLTGDIISSDE